MNVKKRWFCRERSFVVDVVVCCFIAGMVMISVAYAAEKEPSAADSEAADRSGGITLQQCIDIAMQKNRFRSVSRYSIEIAEAQHQQALSGYWPQLSARANYSIMDQDPNFIFPSQNISMPPGTALVMQVDNPLAPGGSVQVPLTELPIPEQNIKLMDQKNFVTSLNATCRYIPAVRSAPSSVRRSRD